MHTHAAYLRFLGNNIDDSFRFLGLGIDGIGSICILTVR